MRTITGAIMATLVALTACGTATTSTMNAVGPAPQAVTAEDFPQMRFSDPLAVDDRWFPLVPGTQLTYEGHALDDGERIERKVVFTVTDLTKKIDGVDTVVVRELDYTDGDLEELELSFFAQDDLGTVWHLGEYP